MSQTPSSKTYMAKTGEVEGNWNLVDATDQVLGRLATKIAMRLMGKDRPTYTPHVDTGEFVVVVNADKVRVTGRKRQTKEYDWYTGYPGGRKVLTFEQMRAKHPERILQLAVRRMLPKNRLGVKMLTKLKIYATDEHPHQAQNPQTWEL